MYDFFFYNEAGAGASARLQATEIVKQNIRWLANNEEEVKDYFVGPGRKWEPASIWNNWLNILEEFNKSVWTLIYSLGFLGCFGKSNHGYSDDSTICHFFLLDDQTVRDYKALTDR